MMKKIIHRVLWITTVVATIILLIWTNIYRAHSHSNEIKVTLKQADFPALTTSDRIRSHILESIPGVLGQTIKNVELEKIEDVVAQNAQLADVRAYLNIDGQINITAKPRKAILRIFDEKGNHLYLGDGNILMENSISHSHRIIVANGHIPHLSSNQRENILHQTEEIPVIYQKLYELAQMIHDDDFLNALIDQIYITKNSEAILTPKLGIKKIEFGKLEEMENKLANLKAFYIQGKNKIDWQKYKSISIKYDNQIVCSKK